MPRAVERVGRRLDRAQRSAYNLHLQIWASVGVTNRFVSEGGSGTSQESARQARGIYTHGHLGVLYVQELAIIRLLELQLRSLVRVRLERSMIVTPHILHSIGYASAYLIF